MHHPQLPSSSNIFHFGSRTSEGREFYLGKVSTLDGENHALVFASQKLLKALTTCTEIHVDATFKMVPPMFTQLMTLNVIKHNYVSNIYIHIHTYLLIIIIIYITFICFFFNQAIIRKCRSLGLANPYRTNRKVKKSFCY